MAETETVTVREASTPDQSPLQDIMTTTEDSDWFAAWDMERDISGVGPTGPLVEYIVEELDLPDADEVRDGFVYDEKRLSEKPLPEWRKDPHTSSPDIGVSYASLHQQIDVAWRSDSNEWVVDIPEEEEIVVSC